MEMKEEKRRYPRYSSSHEIDILSPTGVRKTYLTLDHSEGGIFVMAMQAEQLAVGTEVTVTPTDDIRHKKSTNIKGRVTRVNKIGMGIEFLDGTMSQGSTES